MSAINYAIREVGHRIPVQIMKMNFGKPGGYSCNFSPTTVDAQVRQEIIYNRVMTDLDIMAGLERFLPVADGLVQNSDNLGTSYFYDHDILHNLDIVSVHYFTLNNPPIGEVLSGGGGGGRSGGGSSSSSRTKAKQGVCKYDDMYKEFNKAISKNTGSDYLNKVSVDVTCSLIAKNTVFATNNIRGSGWFKVVLSNDPELTRLPNRVWRKFARLVELATKAYIYKESVITIGMTAISNGVELNGVNNLLESYADAEEMYQEELDLWAKIGLMIDKPAYARYIRSQIGKII